MALGPGPAGLKFWTPPGITADNTADINNLPAGVADTFYPWGRKRPVQDWVWGNLCLYPPALATTLPAAAGSYVLTGSDAALTVPVIDTTNLPAGITNWFNPWRPKQSVQDWFRGPIPAVPVTFPATSGSYTLTGTAAAFAFGHVAGSGSYSITGSAAALALGHVAGAGSYTLTGSNAALALGHVAGVGSYTLTGSNAALALGLGAGAGSYTLTGAAAGLVMPFSLAAVAGSYTLTGASAAFLIPAGVTYLPAGMTGSFNPWTRSRFNLTIADRGPLTATVGGDLTISAGGGSYTITGSSAGLLLTSTGELPAGAVSWFNPWGRRFPINLRTSTGRPLATPPTTLTAAAGSYTITGSSAALALRLTANSGSYTVSGTAAVLARGFAAGAGAYAITGTDANLAQAGAITLTCGAGSYLITGFAAGLSVSGQPPTVEQPGGGYTGGVSRGRMIRKYPRKRRHEDEEEQLEQQLELPAPAKAGVPVIEEPPPQPPIPPQPSLLASMPKVKPAKILKRALEDDEDEDEIALLLELLSRL